MSTVSSFPTLASVLAQPGHEALGAGSGSSAHEELGKLQQEFEQAWKEAGGGTLRSPSLGGTSTTHYLGGMLDEIQERRSALCMKPYEPPTYKPSCTEGQASTNLPAWVLALPPPPPLRRVNAFGPAVDAEEVQEPQQESALPGANPAVGAGESAQTLLHRTRLAELESELKSYFGSFGRYTLDHPHHREILAEIQRIRQHLRMPDYEVPVRRCSAYGCTDENCAWRDAEPVILPPAPERTRFPPRS
jgi:hypothetical protein